MAGTLGDVPFFLWLTAVVRMRKSLGKSEGRFWCRMNLESMTRVVQHVPHFWSYQVCITCLYHTRYTSCNALYNYFVCLISPNWAETSQVPLVMHHWSVTEDFCTENKAKHCEARSWNSAQTISACYFFVFMAASTNLRLSKDKVLFSASHVEKVCTR